MTQVKLNMMNKSGNAIAEEPVVIHLLVDTLQDKSNDGLVLAVKIFNTLNKNVVVKNPLDYLQILLLNEGGHNMLIPQAPNALINKRDNAYRSFILNKIVLNGYGIDTDSIPKETISINPLSSYEFSLKIKDIVAEKNEEKLFNNKEKIPPGKYRIRITLSLVGKNIISQIFQTNPIYIIYN